jgi:hypothetical protein
MRPACTPPPRRGANTVLLKSNQRGTKLIAQEVSGRR